MRGDAEARLREGWTPEIISQRARLDGRAWVCKETIYKHVYADAKTGGELWKHLPRARRKRASTNNIANYASVFRGVIV